MDQQQQGQQQQGQQQRQRTISRSLGNLNEAPQRRGVLSTLAGAAFSLVNRIRGRDGRDGARSVEVLEARAAEQELTEEEKARLRTSMNFVFEVFHEILDSLGGDHSGIQGIFRISSSNQRNLKNFNNTLSQRGYEFGKAFIKSFLLENFEGNAAQKLLFLANVIKAQIRKAGYVSEDVQNSIVEISSNFLGDFQVESFQGDNDIFSDARFLVHRKKVSGILGSLPN